MKKFVIALAVVVMLLSVNIAAIAQVNITLNYTADNEITAFYYKNDFTVIPLPLGPGADWWPTVDSYTATLQKSVNHQFIWEIQNWYYSNPSLNPGGFLAEIIPADKLNEGPGLSSALSSVSWDVYVYPEGVVPQDKIHSLTWTSASLYGANDSPTIWNNALGGPVSGISGAAQWIWGPYNFGDLGSPGPDDRVYIRATINAHSPEPGTIILLGSGLLGLGVVAQIRRKKSKS